MKRHRAIIFFVLALLTPIAAHAQAWSGILNPSRAIDWTKAGVQGGIPNRSTVCATISPSGLSDATDMNNINQAISSCNGKNAVVQLEAGTYTIAGCINFYQVSNVTLRGAGPDKTKLVFTGYATSCAAKGDIDVVGNTFSPGGGPTGGSANWTAGYAKGTTVITVDNASGLSVGQMINLDQRDDAIGICPTSGGAGACAGVAGATESGNTVTITTSIPHRFTVGQSVGVAEVGGNQTYNGWDGVFPVTAVGCVVNGAFTGCSNPTAFQYVDPHTGLGSSGGGEASADPGGLFVSNAYEVFINANNSGIGRDCPDSLDPSCAPGEISWRSQNEIKTVTAIDGNQITISPPVYMPNFRSANAPGIWWTSPQVTGDGVEDLSFDSTNDDPGDSFTLGSISFVNAVNSWAKNVRGINSNYAQVWIRNSAHISVVDSYFFGTQFSKSNSYGTDFLNSSQCLIQNNIFQHIAPGSITEHDNGSVVGYNYYIDNGYAISPGWMADETSANHGISGYLLFEGNDSDELSIDNIHGMGSMETAFRNRFRGQDTPARAQALVAVGICAYQRAENLVGNVLGTAGVQSVYQNNTVKNAGQDDVYYLGFDCSGGSQPTPIAADPLVTTSLLRWGNYDVVNETAQWNPAEIPANGLTFIDGNPVPSSQNLPASFYLSGQPAFWSTSWATPPWPAIGPDVAGGNAPDSAGGHAYAIPSELCYMNTGIDPAYQQTFTVTGATWSNGTAKVAIGPNTLFADDTVTVSGVNPSGYNGVFSVTAQAPDSISYALPTDPGAYVSGGTVSWPNILLFNAASCYPNEFGAPPAPPSGLRVTVH